MAEFRTETKICLCYIYMHTYIYIYTFLKAAPSQVHSRSLCPKPPCSSQARKGPQVGFSLGAQEGSRCSPLGLLNW